MTIKLSADLQRYVEQQVESGQYPSVDAVVEMALNVLRKVKAFEASAHDDLCREIDLGLQDIEEGRVSEWKAGELQEEIRNHFKSKDKRAV